MQNSNDKRHFEDGRLAHELFQSYFKGWKDGASCRFMDKKFTEHPTRLDLKTEYERGYTDGNEARKQAMSVASERLNYEPKLLRAL